MHRRTVRQALAAAAPPVRKPRVLAAPKLDPAKPLIDAMLREDLTAHRKRQHTARRVLARLVDGRQMSEVSCIAIKNPLVANIFFQSSGYGKCTGVKSSGINS